MEDKVIADKLIDDIVKIEWDMFDKVINEGGRADCQDNWNTFSIMRKSQYLTWDEALLESYHRDLQMALDSGINLIEQKYGFMMESTSPERFEEIKDGLLECPPQKRALVNEIVRIQVKWMEEFAEQYPKLASNARSIHTSEDSGWNTSAETYLRGELMTYSEGTLLLYGRFVAGLAADGRNLNELTMENTVHLYGYDSLEDAERMI